MKKIVLVLAAFVVFALGASVSFSDSGLSVNHNEFGPAIKHTQLGYEDTWMGLFEKLTQVAGNNTTYLIAVSSLDSNKNYGSLSAFSDSPADNSNWKTFPIVGGSAIFDEIGQKYINVWKIQDINEFMNEVIDAATGAIYDGDAFYIGNYNKQRSRDKSDKWNTAFASHVYI